MADLTPGHGFDPSKQPERTAEQLAAIHAAMMEELGISRKDELPLEDRGKTDYAPNPKPINRRTATTGLASAWHNIEFDDNDPAEDDLDSIADGQLYRLRRGASYGQDNYASRGGRGGRAFSDNQQVFANRRGHGGRGSAAPRGGHASPGRGGARFSGDARRGNQAPIAAFTQTFFNDARRDPNARLRVDQCLADLRAQVDHPHGKKAKSSPEANGRKFPEALAVSVPEQIRLPRRPRMVPPTQEFSLASTQDFLAHISSSDPRLPRRRPSVTAPVSSRSTESNVNVKNEQPDSSAPLSSPPVLQNHAGIVPTTKPSLPASVTLQPPEEAISQPLDGVPPSQPRNEAKAQSTAQDRPKGLAGSRYAEASDPLPAQATPLSQHATRIASPDKGRQSHDQAAGLSASGCASKYSKGLKRDNVVRIRCNFEGDETGKARLFMQHDSDKFYTFELLVNEELRVGGMITDDFRFELAGAVLTYEVPGGDPSKIWQALFQMPYIAVNFYNEARPNGMLAKHDQNKIQGQLSLSPPAYAQPNLSPPATVTAFVTTTKQPSDTSRSPVTTGVSLAASDPQTSVLCTASSEEHVNQYNSTISDEAPQSESKQHEDLLFDFFTSNPEGQLEDTGSRISCQVYSQLTELAGVDPLISFSDHEDEDVEKNGEAPQGRPQTLQELLFDIQKKDDSQEIRDILAKLDNRPEGTFLQQVSTVVVASGGPPADKLSKEELSSSPWSMCYSVAAQDVVSKFLSRSEIFKVLPDLVSIMWMGDLSRKILALAIERNHGTDMVTTTNPSHDNLAVDEEYEIDISLTRNPKWTDHDLQNDTTMSNDSSNASVIADEGGADMIMTSDQGQYFLPSATDINNAPDIDHDNDTDAIMTTDEVQVPLSLNPDPDTLIIASTGQDAAASDSGNNPEVTDGASQGAQPDVYKAPLIVMSIQELLGLRRDACKVNVKLIDDAWLVNPAETSVIRATRTPAAQAAFASIEKSSKMAPDTVHGAIFPQISQSVASQWQKVGRQQTDMEKWGSILDSDRKPQLRSSQNISDKPKENIPANALRVNGHVPTNSDYDRLAQKLEGWHMNLSSDDQQLPVMLESSKTADHAHNILPGAFDVKVVPPARPSSSASKTSTAASQSMTEKLTTALKSPHTFSPRVKTTVGTANTRLQAIEGQINAVRGSTGERSMLDRCDLPSHVSLHGVHSKDAIQTMSVLMETRGNTKVEAFTPTPTLSTAAISTVSHATNATSTLGPSATADLVRDSDAVLSPDTRAAIEKVKKGPGLASSRWASDENEFASLSQSFAGTPNRLDTANAPVFQPGGPTNQSHLHLRPNFVPLPTMIPPPMIPAQPGYAPLMATIITRDPYTGQYREFEGMLKAGSVPMVPQPVMPAGFYNFPSRPENPRYSSGSSDPGSHFKPGYTSNPLSPQGVGVQNGRMALSPVKNRANGLQSDLQSRLNSSLGGRHGGNSSPYR